MKLRKVLAAAAATAIAATAMSAIASAESYNAYIGFQDTVYSFRNAWNDGSYGKATPYFDKAVVWGGNDEEAYPEYADNFDYDIAGYVLDVDYTDAVVTGDGTYTVAVDGFPWELDAASSFNLLFISTDIPLSAGATVTNVDVIVDGQVAASYADPMQNPDDKEYVSILLANIWNTELDSYKGAYPTESLALEFTIEGLGSAAADTATEGTASAGNVDAATDSSKGSPDTGIESVAVIGGLALLAGAGIALTRKRK
ncbi:MAG: LPXTG cell wall anchor domain-containing protein [Ruminiclostridium sp.]